MPADAPASRPRFRQRWWLPFATLAVLAASIEGAMQAAAYVLWLQQRKPIAPASGKVVLCVGDSWTHGIGSLDPAAGSYPAQLQSSLHQHGLREWSVVNCGLGGQNSRDVLERLPSQLAEYRPQWVCILVGQNDVWSAPEKAAADQQATFDHSAYRFRWRLPRLLKWALGNVSMEVQAGPAARDPVEWAPRKVEEPANPYAAEPSTWPWSEDISRRKEAAYRLSVTSDFPAAVKAYEALRAELPGDPSVRSELVRVYAALARKEESAKELDWLRRAWQETSGYWIGRAFTQALRDGDRWPECISAATAFVERFPKSDHVWALKAFAEWQVGAIDTALASIDRAIALRFDRWHYHTRHKILLQGRRDAEAAIQALLDAYAIDNDAEFLARNLRAMTAPSFLARAVELARNHTAEAGSRQRMVAIAEECLRNGDRARMESVLASHLERMVVAVRNAGAEPVVLCYPWNTPACSVLRRTADEHGVAFVDVITPFTARIAGRPVEEVRAPDGHCNDAGYGIVAGIVEERLLPLLRGR